jgi:hypothetical protein
MDELLGEQGGIGPAWHYVQDGHGRGHGCTYGFYKRAWSKRPPSVLHGPALAAELMALPT